LKHGTHLTAEVSFGLLLIGKLSRFVLPAVFATLAPAIPVSSYLLVLFAVDAIVKTPN
jgi:hypothetical protein